VTSTSPRLDPDEAARFSERLLRALNDGALCLMISIGHRSGLFDALRELPPASSEQIAAKTGLHERYVREWLGAMATGGVVEVDPATGRYRLPPENAAVLTRAAGADNMAVFAQYIPILGAVEDQILECFHKGGGVPYESYPRFHEVMAEDSGQSVLSSLESHVLPLAGSLADSLAKGLEALDVGCGRGRIFIRLAELYPASRFLGIDLSEEAIADARAEAQRRGVKNVRFLARDLSHFDRTADPDAFDLVTTFDAVHDQGRPLQVLRGIHRTLRPEGLYLMQDIRASSRVHENLEHPIGTFLYTVSCLHCMTVSLAQGGEGLGGAMWGEQLTREYLARAGFRQVETHRLAHDIQNNWYLVRK
jgi:2-polyprenyl-3-methyl-5-hydroxy-6-metoxy-1,4-benzoquinol methylase